MSDKSGSSTYFVIGSALQNFFRWMVMVFGSPGDGNKPLISFLEDSLNNHLLYILKSWGIRNEVTDQMTDFLLIIGNPPAIRQETQAFQTWMSTQIFLLIQRFGRTSWDISKNMHPLPISSSSLEQFITGEQKNWQNIAHKRPWGVLPLHFP